MDVAEKERVSRKAFRGVEHAKKELVCEMPPACARYQGHIEAYPPDRSGSSVPRARPVSICYAACVVRGERRCGSSMRRYFGFGVVRHRAAELAAVPCTHYRPRVKEGPVLLVSPLIPILCMIVPIRREDVGKKWDASDCAQRQRLVHAPHNVRHPLHTPALAVRAAAQKACAA